MDNTGKTTLAHQLAQELHVDLIPSRAKGLTKEEMETLIKSNMEHEDPVIFERFCFFEEMVYGKLLRSKSLFTFKDHVFNTILNSNPIIIYCRPNIKTIKNWNNREQMEGVIEQADGLIKRWDKVIKKAKKHELKVIRYNYTKENVFNVISKL